MRNTLKGKLNHRLRKKLGSSEYILGKKLRALRLRTPINQGDRLFSTPKPCRQSKRHVRSLRAVGYPYPTKRYAYWYDRKKAHF